MFVDEEDLSQPLFRRHLNVCQFLKFIKIYFFDIINTGKLQEKNVPWNDISGFSLCFIEP